MIDLWFFEGAPEARRAWLHATLSDYTEAPVEISRDENGRPYLRQGGMDFNWSHSGDCAVLAVTRTATRVGVDIELISRVRAFREIAARYFHPDEAAGVAGAADDAAARDRFLALWTAKEAALKATGEGIAHRLADTRPDPALHPERARMADGRVFSITRFSWEGVLTGSVASDAPAQIRLCGPNNPLVIEPRISE